MKKTLRIGLALSICAVATMAFAQQKNPAVKARQAQMDLFVFEAGYLGAMAQGKAPYDADAAQKAADSLVALTQVDQSRYWVKGTDSDSIEGTRALPDIMANPDDVTQHLAKLSEAAMAVQKVAGTGQDALGQAIGPVFAACGGCHKAYRMPD